MPRSKEVLEGMCELSKDGDEVRPDVLEFANVRLSLVVTRSSSERYSCIKPVVVTGHRCDHHPRIQSNTAHLGIGPWKGRWKDSHCEPMEASKESQPPQNLAFLHFSAILLFDHLQRAMSRTWRCWCWWWWYCCCCYSPFCLHWARQASYAQ